MDFSELPNAPSCTSRYFCCDTLRATNTLDVSGTVLEAVGADFLSVQTDNDPEDGDGCELVIGLLVDALPPFDGATIPPMPGFQSVGCVPFTVDENATCGLACDVTFEDGLNGNGKVPVKNLVSVENLARTPQLINCSLNVVPDAVFFRGDCNFSGQGMGMAVDIADVAAVVSFLAQDDTWVFEPPCHDACDCNDDGEINLADAVCTIGYILENQIPPAPGPGLIISEGGALPTEPGFDPTDDKLGCSGGTQDCPGGAL